MVARVSAPLDAGAGEPSSDVVPAAEETKSYEKRAFLGGVALTIRTGLAQLIILGGTVVMARYLLPAEFGAFAMIQFALRFLTVFGDAGLGGALIQKKEKPTQRELSSVFFAQLALGAVVLLIASVVGEGLTLLWPDLPDGAPWIMRALALNFVLTSLRVVPTLLMERELLFVRLSVLDTVNSVVFYLVAAVLAVMEFRIWSLVIGVLAQGAFGLITAVALRPWKPSWIFDGQAVRGLLGFGVPFQMRTLLALLIAAATPVIAGTLLGAEAVGYINWAHETAFFPLTFVDIIARVSFPLYSRLQDDTRGFASALERSLRICIAITCFFSGVFLGIGPQLTRVIYSDNWLPAVPLLYLYAATITVGMLVNTLAPAFDALGKPRVVLLQMTFVTLGTWGLAAWTTSRWGLVGFAAGYVAIMVMGAFVIAAFAKKFLPEIRLVAPFGASLAAALSLVALGHWGFGPWIVGPWQLALTIVAELVVFVAITAALDRSSFEVMRSFLPERIRRGLMRFSKQAG